MGQDYQAGEPTGEVQVWQNTIPYLQNIAELESSFLKAYLTRDNHGCIVLLDALLMLIDRNLTKKDLKERGTAIDTAIKAAHDLQEQADRLSRGTGQGARQERAGMESLCHGKIKEAWKLIGRLMYDLELVFKQGANPEEAWATG